MSSIGSVPLTLRLKSLIIGTRLEPLVARLRWQFEALRFLELSECKLEGKYLPLVLAALLSRNSNVVDVGAHLGFFTSMALRASPDGHHVAIEAVPTKAALLAKKFRSVVVHAVAASDSDGTALFSIDNAQSGYCRLSANGTTRVPIKKLDGLIDRPVALIKIDVEGEELAVLRGADNLLRRRRPAIIFECSCELPGRAPYRKAIYDHLTQQGYQIYSFADFLYDRGSMSFDEFRKCGLYPFRAVNYLAVPDARS